MSRCLLLLWLAVATSAVAHKPSDSYLTLRLDGGTVDGRWDIALRDLDFAIGLDANQDGEITWGEVKAKTSEIESYALSHLAIDARRARCPASAKELLIDNHSDGAYAVLRFGATCASPPSSLDVSYRLFFDLDPQHKGLLQLEAAGNNRAGVFSADRPAQTFVLAELSRGEQFLDYVREGVWHIWTGFDHVLFLLALLLPAVLVRSKAAKAQWQPAARFRDVFWDVVKVVTAFTLAHSITLSLATLGLIGLPSRLVESLIAASVVLAALNNIRPLVRENRWMIAFLFGLIHGFGFASVLLDLGLPSGTLLLALVAFNVGVELGQLVIVGVFLPIAYAMRATGVYRRGVLVAGSAVIALIAAIWFVQRAFDIA